MVKKDLASRLIKLYQRDFPLSQNPYEVMAKETGSSAEDIQQTLAELFDAGLISRIGPVFGTHKVGYSFLAAMKCPEARIAEVAEVINSFDEVNHNYQRENDLNLWFVMTGPDADHLDRAVRSLEEKSGLTVHRFPMVRPFKIDLTLKGDFKW